MVSTNRTETLGERRAATFARLQRRLVRGDGAGLPGIRRAARERFEALGFPSTQLEDWQHTDVTRIARTEFQPGTEAAAHLVTRAELAPFIFPQAGAVIVFVNGRQAPELSWIRATHGALDLQTIPAALQDFDPTLAEENLARHAKYEDNAFVALNTAFLEDGVFVHFQRGKTMRSPVQLLFVSTALLAAVGARAVDASDAPIEAHPRVLIVAEEGSQGLVVETYLTLGARTYFTNAVTEAVLGPGTVIEHVTVQIESPEAFHVGTVQATVGRGASFRSHSLALGAALSRREVNVEFRAEGGECALNGLYLLGGRQHSDNRTFVDHAKPHCSSNQLYKGVVTGAAHGVFNGRVLVRQDAQKTDAHQTNRNLLLSGDALVDTKPQLEIFADDVRCTHGAAIGRLQEDALFYLRSRGIHPDAARRILTQAFAREVLNRIGNETVRDCLDTLLQERLAAFSEVEAMS